MASAIPSLTSIRAVQPPTLSPTFILITDVVSITAPRPLSTTISRALSTTTARAPSTITLIPPSTDTSRPPPTDPSRPPSTDTPGLPPTTILDPPTLPPSPTPSTQATTTAVSATVASSITSSSSPNISDPPIEPPESTTISESPRSTFETVSTRSNTATSATPDPTSLNSTGNDGKGMATGVKIGVGVAVPIVFIAIILAFLFYRRRKKAKQEHILPSGMPELHGQSNTATELAAGDKKGFQHDVAGDFHNDKDGALLASILMKKSRLDPNGHEHVEVYEAPDQQIGATVSGPAVFEMPDTFLGYADEGVGVINNRSELAASPRSRSNVVTHTPEYNRGYPHSSTMQPTELATPFPSSISRKAVPAPTAGVIQRNGQEASPIQGTSNVERERNVLEERRTRIANEREHLRRMRELDEEELGIENRLSNLGSSANPR